MTAPETRLRLAPPPDTGTRTAFLVLDTESVPDGDLLARVKYPHDRLTPDQAVERATQEQLAGGGSDFLPVSFQVPVAVCVLRVGADFSLQQFACLDAPHYRPREVVEKFWRGVGREPKAKLVTFNGRGFDLPLLELAAFRHGLSCRDYYQGSRNRFGGTALDLCDWLTNFGASRLSGGLNLLAKLLGKPGKMGVDGRDVSRLHQQGRLREINDYCLCDTLDTYFVFLRTRVLTGDLTAEQERAVVDQAREFLDKQSTDTPVLRAYLDRWDDDPGR